MHLDLLTRNPSLYSVRRFLQVARKRGHRVRSIDPFLCTLVIGGIRSEASSFQPSLFYHPRGRPPDILLVRIGFIGFETTLFLVRHYELAGIPVVNSSEAIARARNKVMALQHLFQYHLPVVPTLVSSRPLPVQEIYNALGKPPYILKLVRGTQGNGVMYIPDEKTLVSVADTFWALNQEFGLQRYIREAHNRDIRIIVVDQEVVGAMRRLSRFGEFRANLHQGGRVQSIRLSNTLKDLALRATGLLGLDFAGVDIIETRDGPQILEVNASPGFEGLEEVTGRIVAEKVMDLLERKAQSSRSKASARRALSRKS